MISGELRGRDLGSVPDGVRPTSDRVRESLFSALGSVEGLSVLDLLEEGDSILKVDILDSEK